MMRAFLLPAAGLLAIASCAESPTSSEEPMDGGRSGFVLSARVDLATLIGAPQVRTAHDGVDHGLGERVGTLSAAGCWGYTSPLGRRFALVGTSAGLAIVEVTDPAGARLTAFVPGPENGWREIKSYGPYVYVATEAAHGIDIVDMRDPDRPVLARTFTEGVRSAHTLWVDDARGLLFANGVRDGTDEARRGVMRVYALTPDPVNPRLVGTFPNFYVHDAYVRGTTLYASAINDGFLAVLDTSDPSAIQTKTLFETGGSFTHNSWPSADGRYLFTTDERLGRPLEVWDLAADPAPKKVAEYISKPGTMPHNVMVDGDRLLVAHYTEGVHLVDVSRPQEPRLLAYYDTFPDPAPPSGFDGVWGAYIFPGTDLVIASDMSGGLFVLRYTGK